MYPYYSNYTKRIIVLKKGNYLPRVNYEHCKTD